MSILPLVVFITSLMFLHAEEIDLSRYEKSLYSLHGEDGVLNQIMELLDPSPRIFLDLGAIEKSTGSISHLLRMQGWDGLALNRVHENAKHNIFIEYVTTDNINELLIKHQVQHRFYLLIIDMGYNDFYIWQNLDKEPSIVVIRYNPTHLPKEDKVVKYHPYYCGDGTDYFGASILALYNLGKSKGYSLVYADQTGSNLFFIKDEVLKEKSLSFKDMNDVEKIYHSSSKGRFRKDSMNRPYLSSSEIIKPPGPL